MASSINTKSFAQLDHRTRYTIDFMDGLPFALRHLRVSCHSAIIYEKQKSSNSFSCTRLFPVTILLSLLNSYFYTFAHPSRGHMMVALVLKNLKSGKFCSLTLTFAYQLDHPPGAPYPLPTPRYISFILQPPLSTDDTRIELDPDHKDDINEDYLVPDSHCDSDNECSKIYLPALQDGKEFDISGHNKDISGQDQHICLKSFFSSTNTLKDNQGTLTVFTNDKGGILDDAIVNKVRDGYLYVVSNAGCADQDLAHMQRKELAFQKDGSDVKLSIIDNALIAVQGPDMVKALQPGIDFDLKDLLFMTNTTSKVFGIDSCRVTRCGYTGEDGVEISIPQSGAHQVVSSLLSSPHASVKMIGLGARDSLRLEAGLCLYGSDIDETTTPVEANLTWLVSKSRRPRLDFPGAKTIVDQIKFKPVKRRVGFLSSGVPIRGGSKIYTEDGDEVVGQITSGSPSPSLKGKNISMGYISQGLVKNGTKVKIGVRTKFVNAEVTKMPFVPSNYYFK